MKLSKESTILALSGILAVLFAIIAIIYRPDTSDTVDGLTSRTVQIGNRKTKWNVNEETIQQKPAFVKLSKITKNKKG